jgi:hypothetical protein
VSAINLVTPHPLAPERSTDVDGTVRDCAMCEYRFNDPIHNPQSYLRTGNPSASVLREVQSYFAKMSGAEPQRDGPGSVNCEFCGDAYLSERMAKHVRDVHPDQPLLHNGVSTEFHPCTSYPDTAHDRHLHRPGPRTEWFTCPGVSHTRHLLRSELEKALGDWWLDKAKDEVERVVPKAIEYGSTDLRDIGRDLAECMGREVTDEEATELGIFFYLRGKMSRWIDAVKRGDRPSDDTIYDVGVYCRMAQRNRDAGGWPGVDTK